MARTTVRTRFDLGSGSCADCAGDMTSALGRLPGVQAVQVLSAAHAVFVEHTTDVSAQQIREAAHRQLIIGNGLRLLAGNAAAFAHDEETGGDLECAA